MSTLTGTIGVSMLLGAFVLNLRGALPSSSRLYHLLNAIGAAVAAAASAMIGYVPFVVLEVVWCIAALYALVRTPDEQPATRPAG